MTQTRFASLILTTVLGCASCVGATADDDLLDQGEQETVAVPAGLIGTHVSDVITIGQPTLLVLKTDSTYHVARGIACFTTPCDPLQEDGTYRLYSRASTRYVALYNKEGEETDRYQYILRNDTLLLRRLGNEQSWHTLVRPNSAWCAAPSDCTLQNLPLGPCAGAWSCASSACSFACGPTPPDR